MTSPSDPPAGFFVPTNLQALHFIQATDIRQDVPQLMSHREEATLAAEENIPRIIHLAGGSACFGEGHSSNGLRTRIQYLFNDEHMVIAGIQYSCQRYR
jgi:hypothetical protein